MTQILSYEITYDEDKCDNIEIEIYTDTNEVITCVIPFINYYFQEGFELWLQEGFEQSFELASLEDLIEITATEIKDLVNLESPEIRIIAEECLNIMEVN